MVDVEFVRAARRQAESAERDKAMYWRRYKLEHGAAAGIRVAEELRRQVIAQRPGWPGPEERAEDLAAHQRVLDVFQRTSPRPR